jgi:hypothetical protein
MNALLTIEELCERYRCGRAKAAQIMASVPHIKVGKRLLVNERDLAQYERDILRYPAIKPGRRNTPEPHMIPRRTA